MPLESKITQSGFVWIRKARPLNWKFMINSVDVTANTITDEWYRITTEGHGNFRLVLENNAGTYTSLFSKDQTVQCYADFGSAATLIFEGYIESLKKEFGEYGHTLIVTGQHDGGWLLSSTVTASYSNTPIDTILDEIVTTYATSMGYTYSKASYPCTTLATLDWSNKPFWECVIDLCNLSGYDAYVSNTKAIIFHPVESVLNTNDAAVFGDTLNEIPDGLGADEKDAITRVIVYGEDDEGLPVLGFKEITSTNPKELVINDTDIKTTEDAQARADAEFENNQTSPIKGELMCNPMPLINPAEIIWVDYPDQHIHDKFRIYEYKHSILGYYTKITIAKKDSIAILFKDRIKKELKLEKITNPNRLKYSYNLTFDDDTDIDTTNSSNYTISNGYLTLTSGFDTGILQTDAKEHPLSSDITKVELKYAGSMMGTSTFEISVDGGLTWETVSKDTLLNVAGTGSTLILRVSIVRDTVNTNPTLDSVAVLFS